MINDRDITSCIPGYNLKETCLKSEDYVLNRKFNVFYVYHISLVRNIPFPKSKHGISSKSLFLITRFVVKVFLYVDNIL